MKVLSFFLTIIILMSGCSHGNDKIEKALSIRSRLNESGCEFFAFITADYGEYIHEFGLECTMNKLGELTFTVKSPESISGISGIFDADGGKLTFDDKMLAFPPISEGLLTPVAAPWVFINALKGGYIDCGGMEGDYYRLRVDDSYEGKSLMVEFLMDDSCMPCTAQIYWEGRRMVHLQIEGFRIV